jgi:hypothetical protein
MGLSSKHKQLTYDPAIPLLGKYLKKSKSAYTRDAFTLRFIIALFIIEML